MRPSIVHRFTNMLVRVFQVRSDERDYVLKTLNKTRLRCERTLNGETSPCLCG
jgi:hypothetical protein